MKKVLFYSPYGYWDLHTVYELTIAHALQVRGANAIFICCDGAFSDCDVAWEAVRPRTCDTCTKCIQATERVFSAMQMPTNWLGKLLSPEILQKVKAWEESVPTKDLFNALYKGFPLGDWVKSSVHSHFRKKTLDLSQPKIEKGFRSYLYSGAIAFEGFSRALDQVQPDTVSMLSGRFFSHRVCYELARARDILVINHERGFLDHSLSLWINETAHHYTTICDRCTEWKDVPLDAAQLDEIHTVMMQRETGDTATWQKKFTNMWDNNISNEALCASLRLDSQKKIISMFTSSEDETANIKEGQHIIEQMDWITSTIKHFEKRPDLQLVIRIHPNTKGVTGTDTASLEKFAEIVQSGLPENIRIVWPEDKVNSYQLLRMSDRILVFMSTIALEAPIRGVPAMINTVGYFFNCSFTTSLKPTPDYGTQLADFLNKQFSQRDLMEQMRSAYRHAYSMLVRSSFKFPLVSVVNVHNVQTNFTSTDELMPGKDPVLDQICDLFLEGKPVHPSPGALEATFTTDAENAFLAKQFGV